MIIWRVQHKKNGNGPYQQDTKLSSKMSSAHCDFAHPHPTGDGIPWTCFIKCYHCGMPTLSPFWTGLRTLSPH